MAAAFGCLQGVSVQLTARLDDWQLQVGEVLRRESRRREEDAVVDPSLIVDVEVLELRIVPPVGRRVRELGLVSLVVGRARGDVGSSNGSVRATGYALGAVDGRNRESG
ncbi:hypothetical protein [Natronococcus jeotgali]|uniref:Uncharacterized protein n=1 Tax=Natronococcus jeotgali DSM 18795 TaxID=1227498 RepID=L9XSP4_9EURY|nr:hypothetical protein [Natronococcus jeotgali]ELY64800.1 hypothetical protein C492_04690 [Natronococcus jeotgali DSM 18795]